MEQELIDKYRRIYRETTNALAKDMAKKKLEEAGVPLTESKAKPSEPKKKAEPKAKVEPKPKAEPKEKSEPKAKATSKEDDDYCKELITKERERKAKAKANAQKRANAPKKSPATKNKERVESATTKVEKNVETRAKKGEVKVAEIEKLISEYEDAIKKLKTLLSKIKSGKKFARGGNMDMMDSESASEFKKIKDHNCGCGDKKMSRGGVLNMKTKNGVQYSVNEIESPFNGKKMFKYKIKDLNVGGFAFSYMSDEKLSDSEIERVSNENKMARGGKVVVRGTSIAADKKYKALKEGKRESRKFANVEMRGGGYYSRRNANQYGKTKGGNTYYEYNQNRTDKQPRIYLEKGGNIDALKNFNIDDLDQFEQFVYNDMSKKMSKEDALQIIINNVEGDYSQLSPKLRRIAKKQ